MSKSINQKGYVLSIEDYNAPDIEVKVLNPDDVSTETNAIAKTNEILSERVGYDINTRQYDESSSVDKTFFENGENASGAIYQVIAENIKIIVYPVPSMVDLLGYVRNLVAVK